MTITLQTPADADGARAPGSVGFCGIKNDEHRPAADRSRVRDPVHGTVASRKGQAAPKQTIGPWISAL
jgi:hypothetical protein